MGCEELLAHIKKMTEREHKDTSESTKILEDIGYLIHFYEVGKAVGSTDVDEKSKRPAYASNTLWEEMYPPTTGQMEVIKRIKSNLPFLEFEGKTIDEARDFIAEHIDDSKEKEREDQFRIDEDLAGLGYDDIF